MTVAMANSSITDLPPLPQYTLRPLEPLIPGFADQYLALALPIVAYWAVSLIFHLVDVFDLFPQYRLHTPAEVLKRNHVSRWDVFRDVVIQQIVQTLFGLGLAYFEPETLVGREEYDVAVWAQRIRVAQKYVPGALRLIGLDSVGLAASLGKSHPVVGSLLAGGLYPSATQTLSTQDGIQVFPAFVTWEMWLAKVIYHAFIPALQFVFAICVVDTWQYFLHRAMHMNKWLYTTFHSRHHRLYVPYAYGALYNHPFEGFLLDTLGTGIAYLASGMTCRQSMWFFTMSTIKTVDDHCGYAFPWDPLQHITSNNAGYHDIHHQSWGIKTNFSQPFFTFWDGLLGTKWAGGDVSARYERSRLAAQKKLENEGKPGPYGGQESVREPSAVQTAIEIAEPRAPQGKPSLQARAGRKQVLDDPMGGINVLVEETAEESQAQRRSVRSGKDRSKRSSLRGLADRLGDSMHGASPGVLGVESKSR